MKFCIFSIEICKSDFISEKYTAFFILLKSACSFFEKNVFLAFLLFFLKMIMQYNMSFTISFNKNMMKIFESK